jgi:hypothetical protein
MAEMPLDEAIELVARAILKKDGQDSPSPEALRTEKKRVREAVRYAGKEKGNVCEGVFEKRLVNVGLFFEWVLSQWPGIDPDSLPPANETIEIPSLNFGFEIETPVALVAGNPEELEREYHDIAWKLQKREQQLSRAQEELRLAQAELEKLRAHERKIAEIRSEAGKQAWSAGRRRRSYHR